MLSHALRSALLNYPNVVRSPPPPAAHLMMRLPAFICFVVIAYYSAAVSASRPALVAEWLEQKTVAAAPTSAAPAYYRERDVDWACFKEIETVNCRCIGCTDFCQTESCEASFVCCKTHYTESKLTCCPKEEGGRYAMGHDSQDGIPLTDPDGLEIGSCDLAMHFMVPDFVEVTSDVFKAGIFSGLCTIKAGGECGHPLCDHMLLNWEGMIYLHSALSTTNPHPTPLCVEDEQNRKRLVDMADELTKTRLGKKSAPVKKAGAIAESAKHSKGPASYYVSRALTWSGPVTVSSRKYNTQYRDGFMEYSFWFTSVQDPVDAANAPDYAMIKPYLYTLQLNKPSKHQAE